MLKKVILSVFIVCSAFLCGCDNSKRIDKAVIVESIAVRENDYTFIYIADEEKSDSVTIQAESFEKALKILKTEQKPEVLLSKLELVAFEKDTDSKKIYNTMQNLKNIYSVSPSVYTAVCSKEVFDKLDEEEYFTKCIEQIMILENNESDVSSTLLKMNNNLSKSKKSLLYLPYISSNDGISGKKIEILIKK